MGRSPLPITPVSCKEDKAGTQRIEREKRGIRKSAYEPYIETPLKNVLNWAQPLFVVIVALVALIVFMAIAGCGSYRRGAPARIPGCQAPVIAERGCKSVQFTDRVEVWCDGQKRWTYRCHA